MVGCGRPAWSQTKREVGDIVRLNSSRLVVGRVGCALWLVSQIERQIAHAAG